MGGHTLQIVELACSSVGLEGGSTQYARGLGAHSAISLREVELEGRSPTLSVRRRTQQGRPAGA